MRYKISNVKIPIEVYNGEVLPFIIKHLQLNKDEISGFQIIHQSVDARKRKSHEIHFVFTICFDYPNRIKKHKKMQVVEIDETRERDSLISASLKTEYPPVVVGFGPAGIFAALRLAENGLKPIVLERGKNIEDRRKDVSIFWKEGILNNTSNVQFGEGGAGTFSDGKLTSRTKDPLSREILQYLIEEGAPAEIATLRKPHVGSDKLRNIIRNLRYRIEKLGGQILFNSCMTDILMEDHHVRGVEINGNTIIRSDVVVLAIGHSARDTYENIINKGIAVEAKGFAIGLRIEHKQDMINMNQYGSYRNNPFLKPAEYQLAYQDPLTKRGVYSFCMCPGGLVIASSSEKESVVTNGMSYYARDHENGNSAIVSTIHPKDFNNEPLQGIEFQRKYERLAYEAGGGEYKAPVQLVGDYIKEIKSVHIGGIRPTYAPGWTLSNLRNCLPDEVGYAIKNALLHFDVKVKGFAMDDAILTGVETRTSAPVRIIRDRENYHSINTQGLYPIGEGAGYAGGIMSAAIDGLKCAHNIIHLISQRG
ncbi:MAG: NAD(P)/FAD-dependent oxidoreductase [Eubacteriales bacterium]